MTTMKFVSLFYIVISLGDSFTTGFCPTGFVSTHDMKQQSVLFSSTKYIPPAYTIEDDEDDDGDRNDDGPMSQPQNIRKTKPAAFTIEDDDEDDDGDDEVFGPPPPKNARKPKPPAYTILDDDEEAEPKFKIRTKNKNSPSSSSTHGGNSDGDNMYNEVMSPVGPSRPRRPKPNPVRVTRTNWMEKNSDFFKKGPASDLFGGNDAEQAASSKQQRGQRDGQQRWDSKDWSTVRRGDGPKRTPRQEFGATRVFVQGIPPGTSWQDLKDHFKIAGDVAFASVSVDMDTGESKGHGIVQMETEEMAQHAVAIMRDYPLNGSQLYVREDAKGADPNAKLNKGPTPPTKWKCANEENSIYLSEEELTAVRSLIKARDDARRRKKYAVSDKIRDELKDSYGIFIDDRLKMWWTAVDGSKVPQSIHDIKGDGRWKLKPWRHIPTTPENDACVDPDLVEGLLKQRDVARREKDFRTADSLLEEARTSPDGELTLRIHDESRTWRVWTEERPLIFEQRPRTSPEGAREKAAEECRQIVEEHAPHKMNEINEVLSKFPGREFQVLKRIKKQYLESPMPEE